MKRNFLDEIVDKEDIQETVSLNNDTVASRKMAYILYASIDKDKQILFESSVHIGDVDVAKDYLASCFDLDYQSLERAYDTKDKLMKLLASGDYPAVKSNMKDIDVFKSLSSVYSVYDKKYDETSVDIMQYLEPKMGAYIAVHKIMQTSPLVEKLATKITNITDIKNVMYIDCVLNHATNEVWRKVVDDSAMNQEFTLKDFLGAVLKSDVHKEYYSQNNRFYKLRKLIDMFSAD